MPVFITAGAPTIVKYVFADVAARAAHVITAGDIGGNGSVAFQTDFSRYFVAFALGADADNWRLIDNEAIGASVTSPSTDNSSDQVNYTTKVQRQLAAINKGWTISGTVFISTNGVQVQAEVRLVELGSGTPLNNRTFIFEPKDTDEIATPVITAPITTTESDSPTLIVALQYRVSPLGNPGTVVASDASINVLADLNIGG